MSLRVVVLVAIVTVSSIVGQSLAATDMSLGANPICARTYERALAVGYAKMSLDDFDALRLCYFAPDALLALLDRIAETFFVRFNALSPAYLLNGRHVIYGVTHLATPLKAALRNLHPSVLRHIIMDSAVHAHEQRFETLDEVWWRAVFLANRSESNAQFGLFMPDPIAPFEGMVTACALNSRDLQGLNTTYIGLETAEEQQEAMEVLLAGREKIDSKRVAGNDLLAGREKIDLESGAEDDLLAGKEKIDLESDERVAGDDLWAGTERIDVDALSVAAFNENDMHLFMMVYSLSWMALSASKGSNRHMLTADYRVCVKRDRLMSERILPLVDDAAPVLTAMIGAAHVRAVVRLLSASGVAVQPLRSNPDPPDLGLFAGLDRWKLKTAALDYLRQLRDRVAALPRTEGTSYFRRDSVSASA